MTKAIGFPGDQSPHSLRARLAGPERRPPQESRSKGRGHLLLVTSNVARVDPRGLKAFRQAGFLLRERYELGAASHQDALQDALAGVWGTIAGTERYTASLIRSCPSLRVIARCGVGVDAVDVEAATRNGVAVLTTPGTNREAVADFTLALMLASLRQIPLNDRAVREGLWPADLIGRDLAGATVGLIGMGGIGQAVARRLGGFGCRLLAVDPFADPSACKRLGVTLVDLGSALSRVDVLSIHAPLTDLTRGLIGAAELRSMRRGAVVVNTARGGIVDEQALAAAVRDGHLFGAGLDVFETEPPTLGDPLLREGRISLSGHIAAYTSQSVEATLDSALNGLVTLRSNGVPPGCINVGALRGSSRP